MKLLKRLKVELKNLKRIVYRRIYISSLKEASTIDAFHMLYYDSHLIGETWKNTKWMGYPTRKCPLDFWIYQEILFEIKPDIIIELGTFKGGSALFFAHMCDLNKKGRVISIDIVDCSLLPKHDRIEYLLGSSTSIEIVEKVKESIGPNDKIMVIADSDHHYANVLAELDMYSSMVTLGSYFIVEDGNLNGHPVDPQFGPGPQEAIHDFLASNDQFVSDLSREKFYLTFNPNGYLKRVA